MEGFDFSGFFGSEEFEALDNDSKDLLRGFIQKASGKSQTEALAIFAEYQAKMNKPGKLSPEHRKALIEMLKAGMTPENRKRFELVERFIAGRV